MQFTYKAVTPQGEVVQGIIEAKEQKEALALLHTKELVPTVLTPKSDQDLLHKIPFLYHVSRQDVIFFTRQLASMLTSGLTIIQSLRILKEQIKHEAMLDVVSSIIADVEEGKALSFALSKYPKVFSPVYVALIRSAETTGLLDQVLTRLAETLEKQAMLRSAIRGALLYPAIVVIGMIGVMVILIIFVVPQLNLLYESLNVDLPLPTRIVVALSSFFTTFWPLVLLLIAGGIFGFIRAYKTETGHFVIDNLRLKIPVFGKLSEELILVEFTRTFGILIASGNLVVESLVQASDVVGNVLYTNAIVNVSRWVEKGVTIGDAMSTSPLFPSLLIQLIKIGEQTGKLDDALSRASDYFDREAQTTIKNLTTLLEPLLMVILGIGVAFLIISVISPIYSLTNAIH